MKAQTEKFIILQGNNGAGKPIFSVLVKRTYDIRSGHRATRAAFDNSFVKVDEYYDHGDPQWATVKYETDLAPYKPATDVVVIGKAYAPGNKPVAQLNASVEISNVRKVIRVIGDRHCVYQEKKPPLFTEPAAFTQMEIRYEKAYGGWDKSSIPNLPFAYPRNSMGTGLAIRNIPEVVNGLALPNLEDPDDLLTPERLILGDPSCWNQQPLPQGFGWFQRTWYPRCSFVGAVPGFAEPDEVMREEKLGIVPKGQIALARQLKLPSFDVKFNNGASYGLVLPYLRGNEQVRLAHLTREGQLEFFLPDDFLRMTLDIGQGENELKAELHTVCIRVEEMQVDMVWRGAHEYPGADWLPEMRKMVAEVF